MENPQQLGPGLSRDAVLLPPAGVSRAHCFLLPFDVPCVREGSAPLWVRARSLARPQRGVCACGAWVRWGQAGGLAAGLRGRPGGKTPALAEPPRGHVGLHGALPPAPSGLGERRHTGSVWMRKPRPRDGPSRSLMWPPGGLALVHGKLPKMFRGPLVCALGPSLQACPRQSQELGSQARRPWCRPSARSLHPSQALSATLGPSRPLETGPTIPRGLPAGFPFSVRMRRVRQRRGGPPH